MAGPVKLIFLPSSCSRLHGFLIHGGTCWPQSIFIVLRCCHYTTRLCISQPRHRVAFLAMNEANIKPRMWLMIRSHAYVSSRSNYC